MGRTLATDVYVNDTSGAHYLKAGTEEGDIPKEVLEQIHNPKVWGEEEAAKAEGAESDYESKTAAELLDLARQRGLSPESNKKSDVIAALEESDAKAG
jgi:hypothetical protein